MTNSTEKLAKPTLFIATVLTRTGETGVQTHFNAFADFLDSIGERTQVLTPHEAPWFFRKAFSAFARLVRLVDIESGTRVSRYTHSCLLHYRLHVQLPRNGPWTVYAQCPTSALAALDMRRTPDQRVILVVHFNKSQANELADRGRIHRNGNFSRFIRRQETVALTRADAVVFCSEFMRRELLYATPALKERRTIVLSNFVETPVCAAEGPSGDIISIGTLEPRKNQSFLLRVLAETKKKHKDYRLTIVGRGEDESKLRRLAIDLGINDQVTFAGFVPDAACLLGRHRVYAHSALMESFGITLIEAMAVGLPVLATPVGGIPEIVEDAVEGFLWPLEDPVMASHILIELLENERLYRKCSAAARNTYVLRFSTDVVAPQLIKFLSSSGASASAAAGK